MEKQHAEWEAQARQYQADGYTGAVVARKMISVHAMPEAAALALVGRLYGKSVDPRGGETPTKLIIGLALACGGFGAMGVVYWLVGVPLMLLPLYLALLGAGVKGVEQVVMALVNAGNKEPLGK